MGQSGWLNAFVALVLVTELMEAFNYEVRRAPCTVYHLLSRVEVEDA
jgi:hypothetical protein